MSLREFFGIADLIDVNVTINETAKDPKEILDEMSKIIKADLEDQLTEFVDY